LDQKRAWKYSESEKKAKLKPLFKHRMVKTTAIQSANFHCLQTFEEDFDSVIHLKEALF